MLYAANDAHVALRVYRTWRLAEGDAPTAALRAVAAPGARPSWPQRLARFWSRLRPKRPPGKDRGA